MKRILIVAILLIVVILLIPAAMVSMNGSAQEEKGPFKIAPLEKTSQSSEPKVQSEVTVPELEIDVYRSQKEEVESIPLTDYVIGVVASEMPVEYELEALKAQSLAAQTYVMAQLRLDEESRNVPEEALVTDTVNHQVFLNKEELKEKWGDAFEENWSKVEEAVLATAGQVIVYNEQPITAAFFSTSNGFTENSEDYWAQEIPYLKSVESPWDHESPRFEEEKAIPVQEFEQKLGVTLAGDGSIGEIQARTKGGRVERVQIGDKQFTGRDIREKLDLDSSDFSWFMNGNQILIQTKGWGHGVGMSQFGANGMAKEGKTYKEIIEHYYSDVTIEMMKEMEE
ncbi:stage II sporulation protein D [Alkalihalobacillus sp. LMS6]|uniref:stage II sporulation protein D n=1 Tax=Alkalihalobacillus sp. LMS6 TaxID=2924034 RepID=UPI0020D14386|nr:stage II sporulation protein D [Alkalihalobacillus sp. LMS6]UTR06248.1 stage II sporulation protein D [Alkalihalobacillus sp. LMS6]